MVVLVVVVVLVVKIFPHHKIVVFDGAVVVGEDLGRVEGAENSYWVWGEVCGEG